MRAKSSIMIILFLLSLLPLFSQYSETDIPPIRFTAKFTQAGLVISYSIPSGYYTYIKSPYAKPLTLKPKSDELFTFGKPILPSGRRKGEETVLSGKGKITIPILAIKNVTSGSKVPVNIDVTYQLCNAAQGTCYPPQETALNFRILFSSPKKNSNNDNDREIDPDENHNYKKDNTYDNNKYRGVNSGPQIKIYKKARGLGFKPVSHPLQKIKVHNRVRIKIKGKPGSSFYTTVYYWNNQKWHYVYSPRKVDSIKRDGTYIVEIFFPEAGEYTVSYRGKSPGQKYHTQVFYNKVIAATGFAESEIPAIPSVQFKKDGFRIADHKKAVITAKNKLTITIKGHPNSWLYAYFMDRTKGKYKYLYSPWQTKTVSKDGTYKFHMVFPHKGVYNLSIRGRSRRNLKKNHIYLSYRIKATEAYSKQSMPAQTTPSFTSLGFKKYGLSHPNFYMNTEKYVKLTLRGRPGIKLKAYFSHSKPWKYYQYAPRVFVKPENGLYTVYAWFPEAGTYSLGIKAEVTKKGDRYRKYKNIISYKITSSSGYSDRDLDIKLGYYTGEAKYNRSTKREKVVYGSAGDLLWVTDMRQAERISKSQNRILMILHSASWCGYCKKLKKETFRYPDLVRYARSRFVAIEAGAKPIRGMDLYNSKYKKYRGGIPSVTFISPSGKKLLTRTGYSSGKYYIKVLKNVIAMGQGLIDRYARYHRQGYTSYSFKLIKLYQSLGQKYKAKKIMLDLLKDGKIPTKDLPKYYFTVGNSSWGKQKINYYKKIINNYRYQIGYYWYNAVYKLAIAYYGGGYGGNNESSLNKNEKRAINFITPYINRSYYSPLWRSWYASLIPSIRKHAARLRKKKGWNNSSNNEPETWFDQSRTRSSSREQ